MTPILIAAPSVEPVSLAEAKAWLRIDSTDEDDLVAALVTSARQAVEMATRRGLMTQTWRLKMDRWPGPGRGRWGARPKTLRLPLAPVQRVGGLHVADGAGIPRDVPPTDYVTDISPDDARIQFETAPPAPGVKLGGIAIDVVVGYGDAPTSVPEPLRLAIKMLAARWFENRGDMDTDAAADRLPASVGALIAPYRRARLA